MNILDIDKFISERVKVKPVTNVEWDNISQDVTKYMKHHVNVLKPGDDLQEWDIVVMGYFNTETQEYENYEIGIYKQWTNPYRKTVSVINYPKAIFSSWHEMKDTFAYQYYGNKYIHMVISVYRPKGKNIIKNVNTIKNYNDVDKNSDYDCIYKNEELVERFDVENKEPKHS